PLLAGLFGGGARATITVVAAAVLFTALAGWLLGELRRRSGSLLASAGLHWAANGIFVLVAAVSYTAAACGWTAGYSHSTLSSSSSAVSSTVRASLQSGGCATAAQPATAVRLNSWPWPFGASWASTRSAVTWKNVTNGNHRIAGSTSRPCGSSSQSGRRSTRLGDHQVTGTGAFCRYTTRGRPHPAPGSVRSCG